MIPSICVIIVNYNGFEDTKECIESFKRADYTNYQIVVVDNASNKIPDSVILRYIKDNSNYIQSPLNGGFSYGNNLGIKWAQEKKCFDYILLINNDTVVTQTLLTEMITFAEHKENVGIVGGQIRYFSNKDKVWYGGGTFNRKYAINGHSSGQESGETDSITGCLMLIPKKVIENVGMLPEEYFLYLEDSAYCREVINNGYKLYYDKEAVIYHKVSHSTGKNSALIQYYMTRNGLYFSNKYAEKKVLAFINRSFSYIKNVIRGRLKLKIFLRAYNDFFHNKMGKQFY